MGDIDLIAVVDIGKTNAKLTLTDAARGDIVFATERPTAPVQRGPVRELGVEATWDWLRRSLSEAQGRDRISAIVPLAHGAAVALLDADGELVVAPDYEDPVFDEVADSYAALRDPYEDSLSPTAERGLNVGRQLHFLQTRAPAVFGRVRHIVTHAQYWAWKLSGEISCEVTSLGAHTDLWLPGLATFSALARSQGWAALMPELRPASYILGSALPALGLDPACRVLCGLHDSNASYLCHRAARGDSSFAVVSSGTWAIVMANRVELSRLSESLDMLANVDAFGTPVGTARFMSGREYAAIAGQAAPAIGRVADLASRRVMAMPTFAMAGPFKGRIGRLVDADNLDDVGRSTLASLYVALVVDVMLDLLGNAGDVIIDGPLAQNEVFGAALAAFRTGPVLTTTARAGTLAGARRLVRGAAEPPPSLRPIDPTRTAELRQYRAEWRDRVGPL